MRRERFSDAKRLLWVISGHFFEVRVMSALLPKADIAARQF